MLYEVITLRKALADGETNYPPSNGIGALREESGGDGLDHALVDHHQLPRGVV